MVSAPLLAQTAAKPETSTTTTKTTAKPKAKKPAAAAKKPMAKPTRETEMNALRDAVSAQQQQIQMLRDELARRDAAMQQVQQQVNSLQSAAQQAQSTAQAAETCCKTNEDALAALKTNVAGVETKTTAAFQGAEKRIKALEEPASIRYKGVKITPGGFVALYGFWRKSNTNADATSTLGGFPFDNSSNAHLSEFRLTPRHSNLSLAADGETKGLKARAYFEIDFEGAAATANETISNSFTPRIREGWVNVTTQSGLSFLGGQTWSLLTPNRKGLSPNGELRPATVDASYLVGYHYARLGSFRITKNFNDKVWLAFAVENPEAAIKGATPSAAILAANGQPTNSTTPILWNGTSASCCDTAVPVNLSIDAAPDFVGKFAFEPGWGHYEVGGIGRIFRDRVITNTTLANGGHNNLVGAGGVTFNAVLPVVPKKVDVLVQTLAGVGVGRYGPSGGVDAVFKPNGDIEPVKGGIGMVGVETHPDPLTDFYVYAGAEYYYRTVYPTLVAGTPFQGYGLPNANQSGCFTEGGTCAGDNRVIMEITPVFWHSFYKGPAGTLRMGLQYEFLRRDLWRGTGGTRAGEANEHVIMTAVRWFFP